MLQNSRHVLFNPTTTLDCREAEVVRALRGVKLKLSPSFPVVAFDKITRVQSLVPTEATTYVYVLHFALPS